MNRLTHILVEIIVAIVLLVVIGAGGLVWRLQQQSLSLPSTIPDIEAALNDLSPGLKFKVGSARLEADGHYRALNLRLGNIQVFNTAREKVGNLQELVLGFNWRNLTDFTMMPVALEISNPSALITRFSNGYVGFNLQEVKKEEQHPVSVDTISQMIARAPKSLRHILITNARLRYENEENNSSVQLYDGLFDFHRRQTGITGIMNVSIKTANFEQRIQGTISTDTKKHEVQVVAGLKDFLLDQARPLLSAIPAELKLDMPADVLVTAAFNRQLQPVRIDLQMTGKQGGFAYPPFFPSKIALSDALGIVHYFPLERKLQIENLIATLDKSKISANATVLMTSDAQDKTKTATRIAASAVAENVPIDKLPDYWPQGEKAQHAREWVTTRIKDGFVPRANIDLSMDIAPDQQVTIQKMDGRIAVEKASVDYLPPMPVVRDVNASITFDEKSFDITLSSGRVFESEIPTGKVVINGLLSHDTTMKIDLNIEGPIRDAMTLISSKPLEYAQKMRLTPEQFSGRSKTRLELEFPLLAHLGLDQVAMKTGADLSDMTVRNVVKDLTVSAKNLHLDVDTEKLLLKGPAMLANAEADLEWQEYFSHEAENTSVIKVKGNVTPEVLVGLRLPPAPYFSGSAMTEATITQDRDKQVFVTATTDIAHALITVPEIGAEKKSGVPGRLNFKLTNDKNGVTTLSDADITWPGLRVTKAMARWDSSRNLESAIIKNFQSGRTKADITVSPDGADATRIVVNGDVVDLSGFWLEQKKSEDAPSKHRSDITLRAATLYLDDKIPLNNVKADLSLQGPDLLKAQVFGDVEKSAFSLQQIIKADKGRKLLIKAQNAGDLLRALDITDALYNGTLIVTGESSAQDPRNISGVITLNEFSMVHAPVLARLLNALSPGGLLNLLNKNGLTFKKLQSNFSQPELHTFKLNKGTMAGDSLGLTFSGSVYRDTKTVNLKGTIIPIEGINKLASKIPLIGQILTGINRSGIIGATYTITGPSADPDVTVNPLSVFAPGILRSIFFEGGED